MTLPQYVKLKRGNLTQLAKKLNISVPVVSSWVHGRRQVPASRCYEVQYATGGKVKVKDLRSDLRWK